jgi:hypothetical protein
MKQGNAAPSGAEASAAYVPDGEASRSWEGRRFEGAGTVRLLVGVVPGLQDEVERRLLLPRLRQSCHRRPRRYRLPKSERLTLSYTMISLMLKPLDNHE